MKTALIFGASGQDGWYLRRYLQSLGYTVWGTDVMMDPERDQRFVAGDVSKFGHVRQLIAALKPDEIYNLAALIDVRASWADPWRYFEVNTRGLLNILDTLVLLRSSARVFQATSSGVFGNAPAPQLEVTPFAPMTPYDASKAAAHHLAVAYRTTHQLYVACGILFQHSSPRQRVGALRDVAVKAAEVQRGNRDALFVGNDTVRDWGHAEDYVRAMHLILQQERPGDYCIGTGVGRRLHDIARAALRMVGVNEDRLHVDVALRRAADPPAFVADPSAIHALGWEPVIPFEGLLSELLTAHGAILKVAEGVV